MLLQLCIVIILCWTIDLYVMLNNLVFANSFFDMITVAGMLYLRWTKPELKRPLKVCQDCLVLTLFVTVKFMQVYGTMVVKVPEKNDR